MPNTPHSTTLPTRPDATADTAAAAAADTASPTNRRVSATAEPAAARLRAALAARPGSTAAQLAVAAGIGRSTATRILAGWAADHTATRSDSPHTDPAENNTSSDTGRGPGRAPVVWHLTDPATAAAADVGADHSAPDANRDAENRSHLAVAELAIAPAAPDADADDGGIPAASAAEGADAGVSGRSADPVTSSTATGSNPRPGAPVRPSRGYLTPKAAVSAGAASTRQSGAGGRAPGRPASGEARIGTGGGAALPARSKPTRLRPGALRALVEEFLVDHDGETFGPVAIGRALRRSSGAVANALERLVEDGYALRVADAPLRYSADDDSADDDSADDDSADDDSADDDSADDDSADDDSADDDSADDDSADDDSADDDSADDDSADDDSADDDSADDDSADDDSADDEE